MTTSTDNTRSLEAEIIAEIQKVRGRSMRRLLRFWLEYRGQFLAWIERYGLGESSLGEYWLTVDCVQNVLGCSRRTAYDYLSAVQALELIENLHGAQLREGYQQWAQMALQRGQQPSKAAWIDSLRQKPSSP